MDIQQIIAALDGLTAPEVARKAQSKGYALSRQTVEYARKHPAVKPSYLTVAALKAVAADVESDAPAGGADKSDHTSDPAPSAGSP